MTRLICLSNGVPATPSVRIAAGGQRSRRARSRCCVRDVTRCSAFVPRNAWRTLGWTSHSADGLGSGSLRERELPHQRGELWLGAQGREPRLAEGKDQEARPLLIRALEPVECFVRVTQSGIDEGDIIRRDVLMLPSLQELT